MAANLNLSDYYTKISEMRNKILSKHQTNPTPTLKVSQITFSQNINAVPSQKNQNGNPLVQVNDSRRTINCRVRELDDINDKIKNMLSYKRSAQKQSTTTGIQKSSSIQKYQKNIENKLKMPQSIGPQPKRKYESYADKGYLLGNFRQETKQKAYINKNQKKSLETETKSSWDKGEKDMKVNYFPKEEIKPQPISIKPTNIHIPEVSSERVLDFCLKSPSKQKLVKLLLRQVELDNNLRELKEKYEYYNNADKQKSLNAVFQRRNIRISPEEVDKWTHLYPQQCNPFSTITFCNKFDIEQFADKAIQAKQHWQKTLKQAILISNLEQQNFRISEIDLEEKGYISIEDLVCYLNINSNDAFLRNRDVFCVFKRLKRLQGQSNGQNKLKYETFLNFIAK